MGKNLRVRLLVARAPSPAEIIGRSLGERLQQCSLPTCRCEGVRAPRRLGLCGAACTFCGEGCISQTEMAPDSTKSHGNPVACGDDRRCAGIPVLIEALLDWLRARSPRAGEADTAELKDALRRIVLRQIEARRSAMLSYSGPAVYLKLPVLLPESCGAAARLLNPCLVLRSVAPWTLPCMQAVALHPDSDYVALRVPGEAGHTCGAGEDWIVARACVESFAAETGLDGCEIVSGFLGCDLEGVGLVHPLQPGLAVRVLMSRHVSRTQGALGLSSAHGVLDYLLCRQHGLPALSAVDEWGRFTSSYVLMQGMPVADTNEPVIRYMDERGLLVHASTDRPHNVHPPVVPCGSKSGIDYVDVPLEAVVGRDEACLVRMWAAVGSAPDGGLQFQASCADISGMLGFLLNDLHDFDPAVDTVAVADRHEEDRQILADLSVLIAAVRQKWSSGSGADAVHAVRWFCREKLMTGYAVAAKARLVRSDVDPARRRAAQSTFSDLLDQLRRVLAPLGGFMCGKAHSDLDSVNVSAQFPPFAEVMSDWHGQGLGRIETGRPAGRAASDEALG